MRRFFILILNLLFILILLPGQPVSYVLKNKGTPFITTYSKDDYQTSGTMNSFVQDNRGIIYCGFTDGILEFDGVTWRLISTKTNTTVRGLGIDTIGDIHSKYRMKGTIFVGSRGDIGYLKPDKNGVMEYHSLAHLIPKEYKKI